MQQIHSQPCIHQNKISINKVLVFQEIKKDDKWSSKKETERNVKRAYGKHVKRERRERDPQHLNTLGRIIKGHYVKKNYPHTSRVGRRHGIVYSLDQSLTQQYRKPKWLPLPLTQVPHKLQYREMVKTRCWCPLWVKVLKTLTYHLFPSLFQVQQDNC